MTTLTSRSAFLTGVLLIASSGFAIAQEDTEDHDAHHPETDEQTVPAEMSDMMEMMTPELMQMMMRMMREGGMGAMMEGRAMGDGPMGGMRDAPEGGGMMGRMPRGPMSEGMTGPMTDGAPMGMMRGGMMRGHPDSMRGHGIGPGALYGIPRDVTEMTPARVETHLLELLERHDNPRLELGEISEAEDGSIIAEIVTVDGSLVQRLAFNRYPGVVRQID